MIMILYEYTGLVPVSAVQRTEGDFVHYKLRTRKKTDICKLLGTCTCTCMFISTIHSYTTICILTGNTKPQAVSDKDHSNDDGSFPCVTGHMIHTRKKTDTCTCTLYITVMI